MRRLWANHRKLVIAFAVMVVLAAGFLIRGFVLVPPRGDPTRPVAAWMTPGFVVHTYHIPPEVVGEILGLTPGEHRRQTIAEIATAQGVIVTDLLAELQAEVDAHRPKDLEHRDGPPPDDPPPDLPRDGDE
jgi:hypothetical protein